MRKTIISAAVALLLQAAPAALAQGLPNAGAPAAQPGRTPGYLCTVCNAPAPAEFSQMTTEDSALAAAARAWTAQHCGASPQCYDTQEQGCQDVANSFPNNPNAHCYCIRASAENGCWAIGDATGAAPSGPEVVEIPNPIATTDLPTVIGKVTSLLIGLSGTFALAMFVWAGFQMVLSQGNEKKYTSGLKTMQAAVIGLVIIGVSYAAINALLNALAG